MTASNPIIRDALLEEVPSVLEIWRAAFDEDDTHGELDDVQRVILDDQNARLLLAVADGVAVGTLIATFDGWRGNMYRLAVLPQHQRQGIARSLVAAAEQWLQAVGCRRITALVERDRAWATSFWAAAGYAHEQHMRRYAKNLV
ncbi:MAG TPA: GNAT family N-acetyltransferase [Dehalococcoidia bacterium]|nr:GNAT family N-acetyltransferase [Dehalococcoidia bacterium]